MKISDEMRFPHPVLWSATGDFLSGEFVSALRVDERLDTGEIRIHCSFDITQPEIRALLESDAAVAGMYVTCLETYYSGLHRLSPDGGSVQLAEGRLSGRVLLRPVIWTVQPIARLDSTSLHREFAADGVELPALAVLALADETVINVGREKLAPVESIFQLSRSEHVAPDQIALQLDSEKISITASGPTYDKIHALRGTTQTRAVLLNSVYLPAVMGVLQVLKESGESFEGRRWHRVFTAKLDHLGVNLQTTDALDVAQDMLDSPLGRIGADFNLQVM